MLGATRCLFNKENESILSQVSNGKIPPPGHVDEENHTAVYYAVRWNNVELVSTLLESWPGSPSQASQLALLSAAYGELKIKNVPLSDAMQFYIERTLLSNHLSEPTDTDELRKINVCTYQERIRLLVDIIESISNKYFKETTLNDTFLFKVKFIAKNIHILKCQMRSTYTRLPWEELEFCLVVFVKSHKVVQESNLYYRTTLNKTKIIQHLEYFAQCLLHTSQEEQEIREIFNMTILKRHQVIEDILNLYPEFNQLYEDYKELRDVYSLDKIVHYLNIALSCDPKEWVHRMCIMRTLQITGEFLKNTLQTPKLSQYTSDLLILSIPLHTREILMYFRDALAHTPFDELVEMNNVKYFENILCDLQKIRGVICNIMFQNKVRMIQILFHQFVNCENLDIMKNISDALSGVQSFDESNFSHNVEERQLSLKHLLNDLDAAVKDKSVYEKELFKSMFNMIDKVQSKYLSYSIELCKLKMLCSNIMIVSNLNDNRMKSLKFIGVILKELNIDNESVSVEENEFLLKIRDILNIIKPRLRLQDRLKVDNIFYKICNHNFNFGKIHLLEDIHDHVKKSINLLKKKKKCSESREELLNNKLITLKSLTDPLVPGDNLSNAISSYKLNFRLQSAIELIILDVLSMYKDPKLGNNLLSLDNDRFLMTGIFLRNYLAHGNALVDILGSDPALATLYNAITLQSIKTNEHCYGENIENINISFKDNLLILENQEYMKSAILEGNLYNLNMSIKQGGDIFTMDGNLQSILHYAARGPNVDIFKYCASLNVQIDHKDIYGQSPLHVASVHGRAAIVEYLIKERGCSVHVTDFDHRTPLHHAAMWDHKDCAQLLLSSNTNLKVNDICGKIPIHYVIDNGNLELTQIFFQKMCHVDVNCVLGDYTALHIASERGHLELVKFLIQNGANVNFRNVKNGMPLFASAFHGHTEIVEILLKHGADVNVKVQCGGTALLVAVDHGHVDIVKILIQHKADVNAQDVSFFFTPLHLSAKRGFTEIVKILLQNKASINVVDSEGKTPLLFAASNGHKEIVKLLLENNASTDMRDNNKRTALYMSSYMGYRDIVEIILNQKASVDVRNVNGHTPLMVAAQNGHVEVVELLIQNGADINLVSNDGSTALHLCAGRRREQVSRVLININKAMVSCVDNTGRSPLHYAAVNPNSCKIVNLLLDMKVNINMKDNLGRSPLHIASLSDNVEVIKTLLEKGGDIDGKDLKGDTSLMYAIYKNFENVAEYLLKKGATINTRDHHNASPLCSAIQNNHKNIVDKLIQNGADINFDNGKPLKMAMARGNKKIIKALLSNTNICLENGPHFLLQACELGFISIIEILIKKNVPVDGDIYLNSPVTPIFQAVIEGQPQVLKLLIDNGANIDQRLQDGSTLLHYATSHLCCNNQCIIIQILLDNGINITQVDEKNRTAFELCVLFGDLETIKCFLNGTRIDVNKKYEHDRTVLHIAAQRGSLEIIKYLMDSGADVHVTDALGSKPVHVAARDVHIDVVEYFLNNGITVNERDTLSRTLLHCAAYQSTPEMVQFLIKHKADLNSVDKFKFTPLHVATANKNPIEITKVLLNNGAHYNVEGYLYSIDKNKELLEMFRLITQFFLHTESGNLCNLKTLPVSEMLVNVYNRDSVTPLHIALKHGYIDIINYLLENSANPNCLGEYGNSPLHYAVKCGQLAPVMALLSNGAIYNSYNDDNKTPNDCATDGEILQLLNIVNQAFFNVGNGNAEVVNVLENMSDDKLFTAIMNAHNRQNQSLLVAATNSDFPRLEKLRSLVTKYIQHFIELSDIEMDQENYTDAASILQEALDKNIQLLGKQNPIALDIRFKIAKANYKLTNFQNALDICEEIYTMQKISFGSSHKDTLSTKSFIALIHHSLGRNADALHMLKEVYKKQQEFGADQRDCMDTLLHMALVLGALKMYSEALKINYELYNIHTFTNDCIHPITLEIRNNIAMVLSKLKKKAESLKIFREVYEMRRIILGPEHSQTVSTLRNIASTLIALKNHDEGFKLLQDVYKIQSRTLGTSHFETLITNYSIGKAHLLKGNCHNALTVFTDIINQLPSHMGSHHSFRLKVQKKIKLTREAMNHIRYNFKPIQDIVICASKGVVEEVEYNLKHGVNVNNADKEGRTALHYAVNNNHLETITLLLKYNANMMNSTNKGNTPLHTAVTKGNYDVVFMLLYHAEEQGLIDVASLVNAKTTISRSTSLHVACKKSFVDIALCLLRHGAIYNVTDNDNKTPLDYANNPQLINILKLTDKLFTSSARGDQNFIEEIRSLSTEDIKVVLNARNLQNQTVVQVAFLNNHEPLTASLLQLLE